MGSYRVAFRPSAERELRKLPRTVIAEVSTLVGEFAESPYTRNSEKLSGGENLFRVRIGDYRVVYQVDLKNRLITIFRVRHRKDVYRKF